MTLNQAIFDLLKKDILAKTLANYPSLPASIEKWKQGEFEFLSDKIATVIEYSSLLTDKDRLELGTTISVSTLERIFKHGYDVPTPIDKRRLKTLDKLCIFNGYKDWHVYMNNKKELVKHLIEGETPFVFEIVQKGLNAEYAAYKMLPKLDTSEISKYFWEEGAAFKRIVNIIQIHTQKNRIINNEFNPSSFEILDIKLGHLSETKAEIITREYWYLRWHDSVKGEDSYIYDELNEQYYLLEKRNGIWKIKINYYPSGDKNKRKL